MSTEVRATITLLLAAVLLRLALTGASKRYVRAGMGPWLIVAGVVLAIVGIWALVSSLVGSSDHGHDHTDPDHDHGSERAGWLLLAPIAALLLVAPPALGSYAVGRSGRASVQPGANKTFTALAGVEPVAMSLLELDQRAFQDGPASFDTTPVRVTGFVASAGRRSFRLARYQIACCAADAQASVVDIGGAEVTLPLDTWVTVTGTFAGSAGDVPRLEATEVLPINAPPDPYE